MEHPPTGYPEGHSQCLYQINTTHVDWLGKLHPLEAIELIQCSFSIQGSTIAHRLLDFPLHYPGIDLPREAENCDHCIVGTRPPVPLFKKEVPPPPLVRHSRGSVPDRHMGTQTIVCPDDCGSTFLQGCWAPCRVPCGKQVQGNGWFIYSP